jgi:hypothetical protein
MLRKTIVICALLAFVSCGPLVWFPPEIDLIPLAQIGYISFQMENAEGPLQEWADQLFVREILRSHQEVELIEMGNRSDVLEKTGISRFDPETARRIGSEYGVSAFFIGKILVSEVKPQISISSLVKSLRARISFTITLSSRLIATDKGSTLWTDSVTRRETLAYVHLSEGMVPFFTVRDQDKVYRRILDRMVFDLTRDFRPSRGRL